MVYQKVGYKTDKAVCPECNKIHPTYTDSCTGKRNLKQREYREKINFTNKGCVPRTSRRREKINGVWQSKTKEYKRMAAKADSVRRRKHGRPSIKLVQQVYEDNIKNYGTLTCYICKEEILLGNDHLEHKTPLSRGGKNELGNMDVACSGCNLQKNDKTLAEYLTWKEKLI